MEVEVWRSHWCPGLLKGINIAPEDAAATRPRAFRNRPRPRPHPRRLRSLICQTVGCILLIVCASNATDLFAEDIRFPPDAGLIDVTQSPYYAKADGMTDDTEALQQALLDNGNSNRIIYLPNGIYVV